MNRKEYADAFNDLVLRLSRMECGDYVENDSNGKCAEIANMVGGKYLLTSDVGDIKQTDIPEVAAKWVLA